MTDKLNYLLANAVIETLEGGEWTECKNLDDDTFNSILDAITPEV